MSVFGSYVENQGIKGKCGRLKLNYIAIKIETSPNKHKNLLPFSVFMEDAFMVYGFDLRSY